MQKQPLYIQASLALMLTWLLTACGPNSLLPLSSPIPATVSSPAAPERPSLHTSNPSSPQEGVQRFQGSGILGPSNTISNQLGENLSVVNECEQIGWTWVTDGSASATCTSISDLLSRAKQHLKL